MNFEKVIVLFVIGALIVTSIDSFRPIGDPITREEAIEISKLSELVQNGLEISRSFAIEAKYYNSSMVERLKKGNSLGLGEVLWEAKVLEGHSVWTVTWWFRYSTKDGGYNVNIVVNAEIGEIIREELGIVLYEYNREANLNNHKSSRFTFLTGI